jgi:hypothetical protein
MKAFLVTAPRYYGSFVVVAKTQERALEIAKASSELKGYGRVYIQDEIDITQEGFHYAYSE